MIGFVRERKSPSETFAEASGWEASCTPWVSSRPLNVSVITAPAHTEVAVAT